MRLVGWILLLSGLWSIWRALAQDDPLGMGGIVMVLLGLALLTPAGRVLAAWIGGGLLTGLCLMGGVGLATIGLLALLADAQLLGAGLHLPVRSLAIPLLLLGWGLFLLGVGVNRLWRQYRAFGRRP